MPNFQVNEEFIYWNYIFQLIQLVLWFKYRIETKIQGSMFNHVKKIQLDDSDLVSYMYAFNLSAIRILNSIKSKCIIIVFENNVKCYFYYKYYNLL